MKTYWDKRRENEENKRKRCPVCQSTKINENRKYMTCANCGYVLKKNGIANK